MQYTKKYLYKIITDFHDRNKNLLVRNKYKLSIYTEGNDESILDIVVTDDNISFINHITPEFDAYQLLELGANKEIIKFNIAYNPLSIKEQLPDFLTLIEPIFNKIIDIKIEYNDINLEFDDGTTETLNDFFEYNTNQVFNKLLEKGYAINGGSDTELFLSESGITLSADFEENKFIILVDKKSVKLSENDFIDYVNKIKDYITIQLKYTVELSYI